MRWLGAVALVLVSGCVVPSSTSVPTDSPSGGRIAPSASTGSASTPAASSIAPTATDPGATEPSAPPGGQEKVLWILGRLRVVDRVRPETYDRDAFGSPWADTDGNGCNQRDDVLLRDVVEDTVRTATQGNCDHDVLAGSWIDPYSGVLMTFDDLKDPRQAQAIQIDHVVPLSEAWVSGADRWSDAQRRRYANDLGNLLAVDGPTNASKGDEDPAAWRPKKRFQCAYAAQWIRVKFRYDLAVDSSEVRALEEMLGYC